MLRPALKILDLFFFFFNQNIGLHGQNRYRSLSENRLQLICYIALNHFEKGVFGFAFPSISRRKLNLGTGRWIHSQRCPVYLKSLGLKMCGNTRNNISGCKIGHLQRKETLQPVATLWFKSLLLKAIIQVKIKG